MTKEVKIGNLKIGGNNPIRIKGMLKTSTGDIKALIKEAIVLEKEGVEAIRLAVKDKKDIKIIPILKKHLSVPIVADVHFQPLIALLAIEEGIDCLRLNPLNIDKAKDVRQIARAAKNYGISIRVGINSGGFKRDFSTNKSLAKEMVKKCENYLKLLEGENFFDIMVSFKGSDVISTIEANKIFSEKFDYPLHLGITAAGPFFDGVIKSSIGLGNLLYQGIGDVIRVSLTSPSFWEIRAAKQILQSLNLRKFGPEIISCPTCSRCSVDLIKIVDKFSKKLKKNNFKKQINIAIMGCVVNGPGEAYQADIGVAFGNKRAAIFKKNKILGWTNEDNVIIDLLKFIDKDQDTKG